MLGFIAEFHGRVASSSPPPPSFSPTLPPDQPVMVAPQLHATCAHFNKRLRVFFFFKSSFPPFLVLFLHSSKLSGGLLCSCCHFLPPNLLFSDRIQVVNVREKGAEGFAL